MKNTSNFTSNLIFEHNLAVTLSRNGINPPGANSNVERFYEWMKMIENNYLHDNERMVNAFRIVSLNQ